MISTLIELQRLKGLERTGWMLRGIAPGAESVADHSYGVAVAAMLMADELIARGVTVNMECVLRVALLHDWAEVRVGDMPRTATEYFGAEARKRAERSAFEDIVGGIEASGVAEKYNALHEDYEERESLEARLVKAADVIDLLVQTLAFERAGVRGLDEFWDGVAERNLGLDGIAGEVVNKVLGQLVEERRKVKSGG
ncbi:MAG TPA: HD family hydrolase [Pyrinomonadaceae bacterium]|jgi:putative hydrolase of HD superfamily|nr:HD family hydrolase [Pyrinomonadaceae bacterium]